MSQVVTMRLNASQMERLRRMAGRLGRTPGETSALLIEEALRGAEFGHIDFRDSVVGRQAYVHGTSLAVWEVVQVARGYAMDVARTAEHLHWPAFRVQAALNYGTAFPDEIEFALNDAAAMNFETLSRMLPQATRFVADEGSDVTPPPVGNSDRS